VIHQVLVPLSTAIVGVIAAGALYVRNRPSSWTRSTALFLMSAVLFAAPFALECLVAAEMHRPHVLWFDLHARWLATPPVIGLLTTWLVLRKSQKRGTVVSLLAWTSFFGVANTVNRCQPGWCGRYGFPFVYFSWSDAVAIVNGKSGTPFNAVASVVDAAIIIAGVFLISRSHSRVVASPN